MLKFLIRISNRKRVIISTIILTILLTATFIFTYDSIISNIGNFISIGTLLIGIFSLIITYPKNYIYYAYFKAVIFGDKTLWDLSAKYTGQISLDDFEKMCSDLEEMSKRVSVETQSDNCYRAILDGVTVELSIENISINDLDSQYEYEQRLYFKIIDYKAPFDQTLDYLQDDVMPYLETIQNIVSSNKSNFELTISFLDNNPWVKAVSKGIDFNDILALDFIIELEDDSNNSTGKMRLTKKDLIISCSELNSLSRLVKNRLLPI